MPAVAQRANKCKTKTDREAHLERVAQLDRRGWSQWQIANELGVSQALVCQDLGKIRARYKESMLRAHEELVAEKIVQYQDIRREAWAAYDKSQRDSDKEVCEYAQVSEGTDGGDYAVSEQRIKRITTREGRLPANAYLTTILSTLQAERELLGLDEARKVEATVHVVDWAKLFERRQDAGDPVEDKIAKLTQQVVVDVVVEQLKQPEPTVDPTGG